MLIIFACVIRYGDEMSACTKKSIKQQMESVQDNTSKKEENLKLVGFKRFSDYLFAFMIFETIKQSRSAVFNITCIN